MAPVYAPAYAKVNLSLDVCGRREDGYHLLKTVMQEISLKDDLWAEPWDEIKICCQKAGLPLDKNNIIYKVAKAFFAHTGLRDQGILGVLSNLQSAKNIFNSRSLTLPILDRSLDH